MFHSLHETQQLRKLRIALWRLTLSTTAEAYIPPPHRGKLFPLLPFQFRETPSLTLPRTLQQMARFHMHNMCKPKCRKPLFYAVFSVFNCCTCFFYLLCHYAQHEAKPAIFGLASEVPMNFNRVIFCPRNTSSDNNMVDHCLDRFTIKLFYIHILLDQFTTIISGKNTFV